MCRPLYLLHIYLTLVGSAGTAHTDGSNTWRNQQSGTTVRFADSVTCSSITAQQPHGF